MAKLVQRCGATPGLICALLNPNTLSIGNLNTIGARNPPFTLTKRAFIVIEQSLHFAIATSKGREMVI
jgi:hypothetical protein